MVKRKTIFTEDVIAWSSERIKIFNISNSRLFMRVVHIYQVHDCYKSISI